MRSLGVALGAGAGLAVWLVCVASAADLSVSEQTFGCILDWPQVRNTRIKHADPKELAEAMRILRDSVPNTEYPAGTILQLVPFEAMVKHPRQKFPRTNGWEFFALEVSPAGFDFVREKGHGCAPIPFNDEAIRALQQADARCAKK